MQSGTPKRPRRSAPRGLRVAGLFAGIGGLELGLAKAGHTTGLLCEFDAGARAVLEDRFPGVKLHRDVRDLTARQLPRDISLLAAGFPCQDLSQAGRTAGITGDRSSLVDCVFALLRSRRVPWVLLENVPFMLHLDRGRAMDHVATELEGLGYRWAYRVVDSMAFGLPQRRRRVYLVAAQEEDPADVLFADDCQPPRRDTWAGEEPVGFYWTEGNRGVGWAVGAVPTLKGGSGLGIPSPPAVLLPRGRVVTPSLTAAERLQGFPVGWTEPANRLGHPRFRWRMVGNAVNVPAARWLGRRLARPGKFDRTRLGGILDGRRWPNAACNLGDARRAVAVTEWPEHGAVADLVEFLGDAKELSVRATEGFVFRAERAVTQGKLKFPGDFLDQLREHLDAQRAGVG